MSTRLEIRLPVGPEAASAARHSLHELSGMLSSDLIEDIRLLLSELVTNSVRHANMPSEAWISVEIEVDADSVRVEVGDGGPGFEPPVTVPTFYQTSGWGLYLVGQIATRWGVLRDRGTRVWFEIDRPSGLGRGT
jgi:anti-sigma regulatory factor (Ser/Thr protein kinase)